MGDTQTMLMDHPTKRTMGHPVGYPMGHPMSYPVGFPRDIQRDVEWGASYNGIYPRRDTENVFMDHSTKRTIGYPMGRCMRFPSIINTYEVSHRLMGYPTEPRRFPICPMATLLRTI